VTVTIIYDNNAFDPRLTPAWGFACLIESQGGTTLFDTGGDGAILMQNMATLGIDPAAIDAVVLSHNHPDHVGGLQALLGSNDHLVVYIPDSFPEELARQVGERARVVEVDGPMEIIEGVHTTGEMGTSVVEQSLIVETARGLVVVTGCAHPGIVEIVRRAAAQGEIDLVIGGFHLRDRNRGDVQVVIEDLLALGVRRVAPCHCTGAEATVEFEAAFGSGLVPCGVGSVITIEP
jgi:7,8-dihydropterin-6-yl-methyl-4-(beta-D-ribofuranosyl)aminobenzene 5'-phosphate synthase